MKTNRKKFIDVLQAVKPGLAQREIIEHSTSFIFKDNQLMTYNDEVSVRHKLGKEFKELDGCAIQSKELFALLNKLTDEEIEIEVTDSELKVQGKKNKAGIKLEAANIEEFVNALGKPKDWESLPASFLTAIGFCMFSAGKDMTKPLLTCIYVKGQDVLSSDDKRITHYELGNKADLEELLIPASVAKDLKSYTPTEYSVTDGWLHFRNEEEVVFSCRTMEGTYSATKAMQIIDSVEGETAKLPAGLPEALERAGIFSSGTDIKTANDDRIKITLADGELTVRGEGSGGWFEETTRIRYKGEALEFEVNPAHLQAILSHTDEVMIGERMLKFEGENFSHVVSILASK